MGTDFRTRAPLANLKRRSELARALRGFFEERGFLEVHTPLLSRWCVIDRHLDPIRVEGGQILGGQSQDVWYLQTSPEQSMKRLLASGMESIYQLGPVFRASEFGTNHNPEFTMAEWYELHASFDQGLATLDQLCRRLLGTSHAARQTFADAFREHAQLDLWSQTIESLARWCMDNDLVHTPNWSDDWDDWVNLIFSMVVQPRLGWDTPVLITHFPATQAALAVLATDDPRTAERYELFYRGVELANGYHELLADAELRERARTANEQRAADGKFLLPIDNPLLDAMQHGLPPSCGCALGFDRVVMLACGAKRLEEVIAFPADIA